MQFKQAIATSTQTIAQPLIFSVWNKVDLRLDSSESRTKNNTVTVVKFCKKYTQHSNN